MALLGKNIASEPAKQSAYRDAFEERAGLLEHDCGYNRQHAEYLAGTTVLCQAMNEHKPVPVSEQRCVHCTGRGDLMAVPSAGKGVRVHQSCLVAFLNAWAARGRAILAADGVSYEMSNQHLSEALVQMKRCGEQRQEDAA
jgi:hypothetical protein